MREIPVGCELHDRPYVQSFKDRITYANEVRRHLGNEALSALAISAIRVFRSEQRQKARGENPTPDGVSISPDSDEADEEAPLPHQAYIIRQIKRPEEVALLRGVYGRQFILVAGYAPQEWRARRIAELERRSRGGLVSEVEAENVI
jgi:hypothetical protein